MQNNIKELEKTLRIFGTGRYISKNGVPVTIRKGKNALKEACVFLPEDRVPCAEAEKRKKRKGRFRVENMDSFDMARLEGGRVAVLNFANPAVPGGGVRNGAQAQEESLCRHSSLLLSLESSGARRFYEYNSGIEWPLRGLASDAIIYSPDVCVIRDGAGALLDSPACLSVLTCAAPVVFAKVEAELSDSQYEALFSERICRVIKTAHGLGFARLVAGAWGCGAFGNFPETVATLFYQNTKRANEDGYGIDVDFAVLDRTAERSCIRAFEETYAAHAAKRPWKFALPWRKN